MDKKDGDLEMEKKVGNMTCNILGFLLFAWAMITMFQREDSWGVVILLVLSCPPVYWMIRRKWGSRPRILLGVVRGALLVTTFVMLFVVNVLGMYRCYDFATKKEVEKKYRSSEEGKTSEFGEIQTLTAKDCSDYLKIIGTVRYREKEGGRDMTQDVTVYFDKWTGKYYGGFADMRKYRQEHASEYPHTTNRIDEDELNSLYDELLNDLIGNDYESAYAKMDEGLQKTVTKKLWDEWEAQIAGLGEFSRIEKVTADNAEAKMTWDEDGNNQKISISLEMKFLNGTMKVRATVREDMKITELEVK